MASMRELFLIVRAQNQASGALRRVGQDIRGLRSNVRALQMRGAGIQLAQQRLRQQRELVKNELKSIETGRRAVAFDRQRANLQLTRLRNAYTESGIEQAIRRNQEATLHNEVTRSRLARALRETRDPGILRNYQKLYDAAAIASTRLAVEQGRLSERSTIAQAAIDKEAISLKELEAREMEAARRADYLNHRLSSLAQGINLSTIKFNENADAIRRARWDRLGATGRIIQHFGRVTQYAGLIAGAGIAYAANSAAKFNQEVTLTATQTGKIGSGFSTITRNADYLGRSMLKVGADSTSSLDQLNASAYDVFSTIDQLGDRGTKGLQAGIGMVKLFSDAAIAGMTDAQVAGQGVVAIFSAFKDIDPTVANTRNILNRMFAAVRFGRMTFAELAGALGTISPAARAANQSLDTMLGTVAFLSKPLGISKAAVGFARLSEIFGRKKMVEGLQKVGVSIVDTNGKLLQMPEIVDKVTRKFPELTKGGVRLQQFFKEMSGTEGTIQARRAFVFLARDLDGYRRVLGKTTTDNNEFNRSLAAMNATPAVRWQKAINQLRTTFISFGADAIPVLLDLLKPIQNLIRAWNDLDDGTRRSIARWATYGAIFTIIGAGVAFLVGSLLRLITMLGKGRVLFLGIGLAVAGVSTAIGVLSGDWQGLNSVVDAFVSFGTGSITGWVTMLGVAALAALRLRRALVGLTAVQGATGAAGFAGFFGGAMRGARGAGQVTRMIAGDVAKASGAMAKLRMLASGVGAAALLIPGPLWIAGGAIAAAAGAALLWKHHMDEVAASAQNAENITRAYKNLVEAPTKAAKPLGDLGQSLRDVERLRLQVKELDKQIRTSQKAGRKDETRQLILDRADALDELAKANFRSNRAFSALSNAMAKMPPLLSQIGKTGTRLESLRQIKTMMDDIKKMSAGPQRDIMFQSARVTAQKLGIDLRDLDKALAATKSNFDILTSGFSRNSKVITNAFNKAITSMQRAQIIPQFGPQVRQDILKAAFARGKMLTVPEIKLLVKAEADPKALRKVPADIRKIIQQSSKEATAKSMLNIEAKVKKPKLPPWIKNVFGRQTAHILTTVNKPKNTRNVRATIASAFQKTIKQNIEIPRPTIAEAQTAQVGAAIIQGMTSAVSANAPSLASAVSSAVNAAVAAGRAAAGNPKSPSPVTRDQIGIPLAEGIIFGVSSKSRELQAAGKQSVRDYLIGALAARGDIEKTAMLTLDLFQGQFLEARQQKLGDKVDPIKVAQIEDRLAKAQKRGDAAKIKIYQEQLRRAQPIKAADLQKDLEGQLRQFRKFNNSLEALRKRNVPKDLQDQLAQLGVEGADNIAKLANMSDKELRKYVKTWRETQKEIKRSARLMQADIKAALKTTATDSAQNLLDIWNNFHDINQQNFGDLFAGLGDKVGDGFKQALDEYNSSLADFQSQLKDLNQQLVDVQAQALEQARSDMQAKFGELFSGDWISGDIVQTKIQWGQKLGFDDLYKDLQSQVDNFNNWRENLRKVAARVPPELAKALADLGPDARDKLAALAGATDDELSRYVKLWQEGQGAINTAAKAQVDANAEMLTQVNDILKQIDDVTAKLAALQEPKPLTSQDVIDDLDKQMATWGNYQDLLDKLRKRGLPEQLMLQLAQMGPDAVPYLQALVNMTDDQLLGSNGFVSKWIEAHKAIDDATNKMMQDQLQMWYKHGANIAAAIIAGVATEQDALLKFFKKLFINLLEGKFPTVVPPSDVYTGPGSAVYEASHQPTTSTLTPEDLGLGPVDTGSYKTSSSVDNSTTVYQTVYAQESETLDSTLERSSFRIRNRTKT